MKKLEDLVPEEVPVMTLTVDASGEAWLQQGHGERKRIAVDFTIENEIERDYEAELRDRNGYACWKPTGRRTLNLHGVWFVEKEPA